MGDIVNVDNWSSVTVNRLSHPQISFSFIQVLPRSRMTSELTKEQKDQFEKLFYSFDTDKDGQITTVELNTVMKSLGLDSTEDDLKAMIARMDKDGNGHIDLEEFLKFCAQRLV